jgi:hypothetical protein
MRSPTRARLTVTVALALALGAAARAEDDAVAPPADAEPAAGQVLPWACFAISVAALGGLYVFVRRREQAIEADLRRGRRPPPIWYCRACARDVSGPACPHCQGANPFLDESAVVDTGTRSGRKGPR